MLLGQLDAHAQDLATSCLAWSDRWWDAERELLRAPQGMMTVGGSDQPVHLVPQTAWYAAGLLLRGAPGDDERAARAIASVIDLQYDEPGSPIHGTYARFGDWPHPGAEPEMWVDYDPNWRQFVGTTFLVILDRFGDRLAPELAARVEDSVRLGVAGEPPDRVPPSYSNIALMRAWLEVEVGTRSGRRRLVGRGEELAAAVVELFEAHGAFEEYNSPTYYGIDLYALGLWRSCSSSPRLRQWGAQLEAALWTDVARWYHAGLGNLAGPYTRAYGMDMHRYVAALALWLWAALGRTAAPLPPLDGPEPPEHGWDLHLAPMVALVGASIPAAVPADLLEFRGERTLRQQISSEPERVATGWLAPTVMVGAERAPADLSWWNQYHAATVHWHLPDDGVGWILARIPGPSDAGAAPGRLTLRWHAEPGGRPARLVVHAPGVDRSALAKDRWELPGLSVGLTVEGAEHPTITDRSGRLVVSWPPPERPTTVTIHLDLTAP